MLPSRKKWLVVLGALCVVLGLSLAAQKWQPRVPPTAGREAPQDEARSIGAATAPVTLIEYGDFECPFCARFSQDTLPEVLKQYARAGIVRVIYRDYPLIDLHPSALLAAVAGRCAAAQGQFWPLHDRLFATHGSAWGGDPTHDHVALLEFAQTLDLDRVAFGRCLDDQQMTAAVRQDVADATNRGVRATPTFVINGQMLSGALRFEVFQRAIEQARSTASVSYPSSATVVLDPHALAPLSDDDPRSLGQVDAPVMVVVYEDFECPFCAHFERETLSALRERYVTTGIVHLIYRDYPLTDLHASALLAAVAGRCAAAQGQFWPLHDRLFATHGTAWGGAPTTDRAALEGLTETLKLDRAEFHHCLDDPQIAATVKQEAADAARMGVRATPTVFINGRLLVGAVSFRVLQRAIEQARQQAGAPTH